MKEVIGNLFESKAEALVNPVNCVGVMGKGLALEFRRRFPGMFEDYLERQGRDWERYAWIKARAVTGARLYEQVFRASVRPFVYRRYLDFGVFEALRDMKALIEREVLRRELKDNIKLGPGGIREIEFIVQSLQLIRGGTERRLQSASLLHTLPLLATISSNDRP